MNNGQMKKYVILNVEIKQSNTKQKTFCSCFDTEPLCGNNLRNNVRHEHARENDMKKRRELKNMLKR